MAVHTVPPFELSDCAHVHSSLGFKNSKLRYCIIAQPYAAFRNSLLVLKIYNIRYVDCRFLVLAVNFGTQPCSSDVKSVHRAPARTRENCIQKLCRNFVYTSGILLRIVQDSENYKSEQIY